MDNELMLNEITQDTAFKTIISDKLGASVLQPNYRNEFIRVATRDQTILSETRRIIMNSHIENIDRTGFSGRIMEKPGENKKPIGKNPYFKQEKLEASEYIALSGITDQALRRNIERTNYSNTLVQMMGEQFGQDWETLAVGGSKNQYKNDSLLHTNNGWIEKCENRIFGEGEDPEFGENVLDMLNTMIDKFPKNYIKNRSNLRFYLNSNYFDTYIEELGTRPTIIADEVISTNVARPYKGIPVKEATVLNDEEILSDDGYGSVALLMDPNNMVYGIFHEITIEPDRNPIHRKTDYVITTEIDQGFENPEIGVVAFPESESEPSQLPAS